MQSVDIENVNVFNNELVTNQEELLVQYLKKNYLENVNNNMKKVIPRTSIYTKYVKRILDIIISGLALVIFFPINIVIGICTLIDVGIPIFFKQTRVGKNGKVFLLIKFRNMKNVYDKDGKLLPPSQRVTKFGKFIRTFSLDELLNFWSVFKGDMSIIGPRPLPETFTERMSERHKMRNCVRPGLECPRMLEGNPEICQYQNQFENDLWYVENVSFNTDMKMLFKLFKMTFSIKKRKKSAVGNGYFAGYDESGLATTLNRFKRMYPDKWEHLVNER
jgi:lipopolysaccharide/colanic/teichoic acid biosynthesis glycosyltransferase